MTADDQSSVVVARGLTRRFGHGPTATTALVGIDLALSSGQFVGVTGPSGCGKSTLLNLVGLLDLPSDGELYIGDVATHAVSGGTLATLRRKDIGFLFQDGGLISAMSVLDNVVLPLRYAGRSRRDAVALAEAGLANFRLDHLARRRVDLLSGGERQRVALVRALAKRPALLVCDEPTASLDERNSRMVTGILRDYAAKGSVVLCSTHDLLVMEQLTHRIDMSRGQIVSARC